MADPIPNRKAHDAHGSWGGMATNIDVEGKGSLFVRFCDLCHYVTTTCNHEINKWVYEERDGKTIEVLRCQLCGIDGT